MWPYLVTFELTDPTRHAAALGTVLRDMGAVPLTGSAWLFASDWNASAIVEQLRPIIGGEDKLLVLELGDDIAALNLEEATTRASLQLDEMQNSSVH